MLLSVCLCIVSCAVVCLLAASWRKFNYWRDVWLPQVAMYHNNHLFFIGLHHYRPVQEAQLLQRDRATAAWVSFGHITGRIGEYSAPNLIIGLCSTNVA